MNAESQPSKKTDSLRFHQRLSPDAASALITTATALGLRVGLLQKQRTEGPTTFYGVLHVSPQSLHEAEDTKGLEELTTALTDERTVYIHAVNPKEPAPNFYHPATGFRGPVT